MKLNFRDGSDWVRFVIKTRQYNDVVDRIGLAYIETETKLSAYIESGSVYYENRQDNDVTDLQVQYMVKLKLNYWDLSDRVQFVIKTRQENYMIDCTGMIYAKNEGGLCRK